ncbi:hypothetical protein HBF26_18755 [Luteibacter jiangsuensis]|uniref:Beta-barrel assembly machine subunit BamC n=1 Tax=Luteibacter jiangsuensis TaxID=637577 RepID=A0ABX0QB28_9GAMM|nr:hypothetical protein [Luteibacter jiangsuensis]NID06935.1 hypothetical protein [Luteibacter jiangsuensis]
MKKTSYALVVPALLLSVLVVSGCGAFRSKKDWERAQQEAPLEIPPGLDTPSTSAALVIPDVGSGAQAAAANQAAPVSDGFILADDADAAYRRIGELLSVGDLGKVTSHDDATHTYQIAVNRGKPEGRPGFFRRMFGGGKNADQDAKDAPASAAGAAHTVQLAVTSSGTGSEVRAQGDADGVRRVIDALKSRMGSK